MSGSSYATKRKVRIIESRLGADWTSRQPGRSVDAVYNEVVGDTRKNLFCKVTTERKEKLDQMVKFYDLKMSEMIERLIDDAYVKYEDAVQRRVIDMKKDFSG